MTPDGMVSSLAGPVEGPIGDCKLFKDPGIESVLRSLFSNSDSSDWLYLYRDPAYYGRVGVMGAYRARLGFPLTQEQKQFNTHMSRMRISVEHGFGLISQLWKFDLFHYTFQVWLSPVAAFYIISVFLSNIYTCLRGNLVSDRFLLSPPTLAVYLAME
jgi:hypothetical protein